MNGRMALQQYVKKKDMGISPIFAALHGFEVCLSQTCQAKVLWEKLPQTYIHDTGGGSVFERVRFLHNTSKHMDERIEKGNLPEDATAAIWITSTGLEGLKQGTGTLVTVSFRELVDLLECMSEWITGFFSRLETKGG